MRQRGRKAEKEGKKGTSFATVLRQHERLGPFRSAYAEGLFRYTATRMDIYLLRILAECHTRHNSKLPNRLGWERSNFLSFPVH